MNSTEKPSRVLSSTICSMMSRCTTTSSAVVGSSMMMSLGLSASAMAMQMRWRMPPENWCAIIVEPLRRNADQLEQLHGARPRALLAAAAGSCVSITSMICSEIGITGLSAFIADWKTKLTSRQR